MPANGGSKLGTHAASLSVSLCLCAQLVLGERWPFTPRVPGDTLAGAAAADTEAALHTVSAAGGVVELGGLVAHMLHLAEQAAAAPAAAAASAAAAAAAAQLEEELHGVDHDDDDALEE